MSQINIIKANSVSKLVTRKIAGDSIEILKVRYRGDRRGIAEFSGDSVVVPMKSGIFLCTGLAKNALGPNNSTGKSSNVHQKGDKELDKICKNKTHDAAILDIDFIPRCKFISFNFVFASDEYPEFVSSSFNDVFAFILTDAKGRKQNLAIVPGSKSRITINTINYKKNAQYFINNAHSFKFSKIKPKVDTVYSKSGNMVYTMVVSYNIEMAIKENPDHNIQYDGLTKVLQAKSNVVPGQKYHLKIAIADASDHILDSGVFIEYGSFNSHNKKDYTYGALATKADYYRKTDTVLVKEYRKREAPASRDLPKTIEVIEECDFEKETLLFDNNEYEIRTEYYSVLDSVIAMLKQNKNLKVNVYGYTDAKGNYNYNQKLSEKRAGSVSDYLIKRGIPKERILVKGIDKEKGKYDVARSYKGRRVDVELYCP